MTAVGLGLTAVAGKTRERSPQTEAVADVDAESGRLGGFAGRLIQFIPGDVVAGYTAAFALVPAGLVAAEWGLVAFCLVMAAVLVLLGYIPEARKMGVPVSLSTLPWFRIFSAPVAFAIWMIALPSSPFDTIYGAGWFKTVVLVFGSTILAASAPVFERPAGP